MKTSCAPFSLYSEFKLFDSVNTEASSFEEVEIWAYSIMGRQFQLEAEKAWTQVEPDDSESYYYEDQIEVRVRTMLRAMQTV